MSKFCNTCGQELDDSVVFCPACGANNAPAEQAAPVEADPNPAFEAPVEEVAAPVEEAAPALSVDGIKNALGDKLKLIIVGAAGLVVVILAIVLISSLFGGGYKDPLKYADAVVFDGKFEKVEKLYPEAYWTYLEDETDESMDDIIDELEDESDEFTEGMEKIFGEKAKFTYKITEKEELSEKKLKDIQDGLKDRYDIPKKSVTKAMELEYDFKIKGADDEDEGDGELIVAKIDGKWYPVNENGSLLGVEAIYSEDLSKIIYKAMLKLED